MTWEGNLPSRPYWSDFHSNSFDFWCVVNKSHWQDSDWVSIPLKSDDKGREPTRPPPLNSYNFNLTWGLNAHLKGLRLQWVRWQEGNNLLGRPHWSDCCSAGAGCSIPNPPSGSFYRISIVTHNHKTVGLDLRAGFKYKEPIRC